MSFQEHNNRSIAKQYAEFITGDALRRFAADVVRRHAGEHPSIFDGAAGSGQLQQYLKPSRFEAVEIQAEACAALKNNYPSASVYHRSFFLHEPAEIMDCALMNPPFSLKFKDLSDEERAAVQKRFPWKKSGVMDDVFILKSLQHAKRWSVQIAFPGIAYRRSDAQLRQSIGARLAELWAIHNAFEDTDIAVLLLVIDQEKTKPEYRSAVYDCKDGRIKADAVFQLQEGEGWPIPREAPPPPEALDIDAINREAMSQDLMKLRAALEWNLFLVQQFRAQLDYLQFIKDIRALCDEYQSRIKPAPETGLFY